MTASLLLPGITQHFVPTSRLRVAYLEAGAGPTTVVLLHANVVSSLIFQDFMLALAPLGPYRVLAPDLRGFGASQVLPVDATRGLRDFADDLASWVEALQLPSFHVLGWSLGGNVAVQYALDYPGRLRSLALEAPGSPFGYLGTKDAVGNPTWPDYAGSGGGTVHPDFLRNLAQQDRGPGPAAPRSVLGTYYLRPGFPLPPDREDLYVDAFLSTALGPDNYPGDSGTSANWPHVGPGTRGVMNAFSPKYLNQSALADLPQKPPVWWLHGTEDAVVSDASSFDFGVLGRIGRAPGWPGEATFPPQPMKAQIRHWLAQYQAQGGAVTEHELSGCGHTPHIEQAETVVALYLAFLTAASA